MTTAVLGRVQPIYKGAYVEAPTTPYGLLDIVTFGGKGYIAKVDNITGVFDPLKWDAFTPDPEMGADIRPAVYVAAEGQTVFAVSGGYTPVIADVYKNGAKLINNVDVSVADGSTFVLTEPAVAGDELEFIGYSSFAVADTYTKAVIDSKFVATNVSYNNTTSGRTATQVQAGLDEAFGEIDGKVALTDESYYQKDNILGTVSQTAGVPTGAIIQRGSNANGEFVRYVDGTQICLASVGLSTTSDVTWTYPIAFVNDSVAIGGIVNGAEDRVITRGIGTVSSTSTSLRGWVVSDNSRTSASCRVSAIGKWF